MYNILDKDFMPAIIELRKFKEEVLKSGNVNHLIIAVEIPLPLLRLSA